MRRVNAADAVARPLAEALVSGTPLPMAIPAGHDQDPGQRRLDALREEARRQGRENGLADAEAEIARRTAEISSGLEREHAIAITALQEQMAAMKRLAAALTDAIGAHRRDAESAAVEAAYAALVRVLGEKAADRTLVSDLCMQILREHGTGTITFRLSPADCELFEPAGDVRVRPDATLCAGQCVLESPRGGSDTGLDVRLEAIRIAFIDGLAAHRGQE